MGYSECHPQTRCITCPLRTLKFADGLKASQLIETVMEGELTNESSLEEVVSRVKDMADIQESEMVAPAVIGAVAYRLTGRCPQFVHNDEGQRLQVKEAFTKI